MVIPVQTCRRSPQEQNGVTLTPRGNVVVLVTEVIDPTLPRKAAFCDERLVAVPETDTGGQVENTKALGRSRVKELGKLTP